MMPQIILDNLTVSYSRHPAVHHLSGIFKNNSLTAVVGLNGAGKSTLIKAIAGLAKPSQGKIILEDIDSNEISYLPQIAEIDKSFPVTVLEMALTGFRKSLWNSFSQKEIQKAKNTIALVGLKGFENRLINNLSAGQFQKIIFARTILEDNKIILLDEPLNGIDSRTCDDLLDIINRWHQNGKTVIAVLHDIEQVKNNFPETLLIAKEIVAWGKTSETLTEANLLQARHLMSSHEETAEICQ